MTSGTLVFFDGLPLVTANSIPPLRRFLLRQLGEENPNDDSKMHWLVDRHNISLGIAVVRFAIDSEAQTAIDTMDGRSMDRERTFHLETVEGSERFRGVQAHGVVDEEKLAKLPALNIRAPWTGSATAKEVGD